MRVLFIGGSGIISSACTALAVQQGIELYLLKPRAEQHGLYRQQARLLQADIRQPASVETVLGDLTFDAVVEWVAYTPEQCKAISICSPIAAGNTFLSARPRPTRNHRAFYR